MLMSAIRRLRKKWRVRRERKTRLHAARYEPHGNGPDVGSGPLPGGGG
jgi:hypothetical protein